MPEVFLGLGSNVGDRERNIVEAVARLERRGFQVARRSALYLTEPVALLPQGWFVNAVVSGTTSLSPEQLLREGLEVERELGRVRDRHHGPRTMDVDLLVFGDTILDTPDLVLPHPRLHERRFVLVPLHDVAPGLRHPVLEKTVAELLRDCPDTSAVNRHRPPEAWTS